MEGSTVGGRTEAGLSEVVGFVLLLGVIVAAMALWMMYVVPVEGREDEISHMNDVKDRFTDYKITLDSLWLNNEKGISVSSSFNLGTGGGNTQASGVFLHLLKPIGSSAVISVKDTGDRMWINTSNSGDHSFVLSILEYQSQNNYWIQQRYYYQTGGVFLAQDIGSDSGKTCRVSPPFSFIKAKNESNYDIAKVNLVPIQLIGGSSFGGEGPVRVDTWMRPPQIILDNRMNNWVQVSVNVSDIQSANMWLSVFNETRKRGLIRDTDTDWYTFGINTISPDSYTAYMRITSPPSSGSGGVVLTMRRVDYDVSLNNIISGLT